MQQDRRRNLYRPETGEVKEGNREKKEKEWVLWLRRI